MEFREQGKTEWNSHEDVDTGTETTIRDLFSNTSYDLRVRSVNAEGHSTWSLSGGTTDMAELVVMFGADSYNAKPNSKTVNVRLTVNPKADRTVRVNVEVVGEAAILPGRPDGQAIIRRRARSAGVDVEFQVDDGSVILRLSLSGRAEKVTLGSPASAVVSISDNLPPVFGPDTPTEFSVAENSGVGQSVGTVQATDPGDALTYELSGIGSDKFIIDNSGLIAVAADANLDYEGKASYTVTVTAKDSVDQSVSIDVTVSIFDVDEPPPAPDSVTVAPSVDDGHTILKVEWTVPAAAAGVPATTGYRSAVPCAREASWTDRSPAAQVTTVHIDRPVLKYCLRGPGASSK